MKTRQQQLLSKGEARRCRRGGGGYLPTWAETDTGAEAIRVNRWPRQPQSAIKCALPGARKAERRDVAAMRLGGSRGAEMPLLSGHYRLPARGRDKGPGSGPPLFKGQRFQPLEVKGQGMTRRDVALRVRIVFGVTGCCSPK